VQRTALQVPLPWQVSVVEIPYKKRVYRIEMDNPKIITRDFVLAFLSQFVFSFAFSMLIPTLPIYLLRLGSREETIGILIGVFSVSSLDPNLKR
jgi:amino acid permease